MTNDVRELLLHTVSISPLLHMEHLVFLNQRVIPSMFYVICSFMSYSLNLLHFSCTSVDGYPIKLING